MKDVSAAASSAAPIVSVMRGAAVSSAATHDMGIARAKITIKARIIFARDLLVFCILFSSVLKI